MDKYIFKFLYRFYEMVLWFIFLIVNIFWGILIFIPYLFTGKDYITPIAKLYEKCLFKKKINEL